MTMGLVKGLRIKAELRRMAGIGNGVIVPQTKLVRLT
jgi:hypothetical protein